MKRLILSATAATLALSSMTAAAWWGQPYAGRYYGLHAYGAPYVITPTSPQQLQQMAERQRKAAIEMMEAQRRAMYAERNARGLPRPEMPDLLSDLNLPEPPAFGERPAIPEFPTLPELSRPQLPVMPDMPELPEFPTIPGDAKPLAMPEFSVSREQREAEIEAYRAALKQQAAERRAAMQAIAEQRRSVAEQRRQDWLCARQAIRPMPYRGPARDCESANNQSEAAPKVESSDQTADSLSGSNKSS